MKCKYDYDGKCNLKYISCPGKCEDFVEDKFLQKGKDEEYA